jgi:hypothetical protein
MSEALGWKGCPKSMEDLLIWLPEKFSVSYHIGLSCFAGIAWALWTTRNKFYIRKVFPEHPIDVVFLCLPFIQKWRLLMRKIAIEKLETTQKVLRHTKDFKPLDSHPSHVGFIWFQVLGMLYVGVIGYVSMLQPEYIPAEQVHLLAV